MENQIENKRFEKEIKLKTDRIQELEAELINTEEQLIESQESIILLLKLQNCSIMINEYPDDVPDDVLIDFMISLGEFLQTFHIEESIYLFSTPLIKCSELLLNRGIV